MDFMPLLIEGAYLLHSRIRHDERGSFARTFCRREFAAHDLNPDVAQCSISATRRQGTLRGMHWQAPPHEEAKLVRCIRGAIHDVIVDLRPDSETYLRHEAVTLDGLHGTSLYVPEGVAHGYLTLTEDVEVLYQMSAFHEPEAARGVRWNDPVLGIEWPGEVQVITKRDQNYPDYVPELLR